MNKFRNRFLLIILCVFLLVTSCYPFITNAVKKKVTVTNPTDLPVLITDCNLGTTSFTLEAYESRTFETSISTNYFSCYKNGAYYDNSLCCYDLNPLSSTSITLEPDCTFVIVKNFSGKTLDSIHCGLGNVEYDPQKPEKHKYTVYTECSLKDKEKKGARMYSNYTFRLSFEIDGKTYFRGDFVTPSTNGESMTLVVNPNGSVTIQ